MPTPTFLAQFASQLISVQRVMQLRSVTDLSLQPTRNLVELDPVNDV